MENCKMPAPCIIDANRFFLYLMDKIADLRWVWKKDVTLLVTSWHNNIKFKITFEPVPV